MEAIYYLWIAIQLIIGYNLFLPIVLYLFWKARSASTNNDDATQQFDYAVIVTAYEQVDSLADVVNSILKANYSNYLVYIVADKCDVSTLMFTDERIIVLKPEQVLASNTKSHRYAMDRFIREHDLVTIIDSDNLLHADYFAELNVQFGDGFNAVQGLRKAKNLDTTISALDAARDVYYHFYDGKILFQIGSSATLSGSGMAFRIELYRQFLEQNSVSGAGFDKVLQAWIVRQKHRIAFTDLAIVYDQKTSRPDQLVNQRARWINTWFKYFLLGFNLIFKGIANLDRNQLLFGLILIRPPLFMFILTSGFLLILSMFISFSWSLFWLLGFVAFVSGFYLALLSEKADKRIYHSLTSIPRFVFLQLISLSKSRNANKRSVATKHAKITAIEDLAIKSHEDQS